MQTSNQAIRDQKPIKKGINNPKTGENYTKIEIFIRICPERVYDSTPTQISQCLHWELRSHNQEQKYKRKKTKQDTNMCELTHKSKTQSHPIN